MSLIHELKNKKIIKFGDYTLRSGIKSKYYCDIKEALGNPKILDLIVNQLIKDVPKNSTCIAGSGYGGISLASLVAYKLRIPLVLVRDKVKNHGTKKTIDGYLPTKKDIVCIVDDVFTTGSSLNETREKLAITGVRFCKPVVVLKRKNSKNVICLISDKDIFDKIQSNPSTL